MSEQLRSRKYRILLADDEPDIVLVAKTRLECEGFDVITAGDGEEALARFRSEKPDLVLVDLAMPRVDGFEVCRVLKSDPATKATPIIVFSASSPRSRSLESECLRLRVEGYVRKPYTPAELLTVVRRCLADCQVQGIA